MQQRTYSYWEVASRIAERQAASNAPLPHRTDALIVGAGFCGSWLAYFLLKQHPSLTVTIVERDVLNLGASVRNAGFLSCGNISEWLEDSTVLPWEEILLTLRARIQGIRLIRTEFGDTLASERCGSADFDPLTDEKRLLFTQLNEALGEMGEEPFFEMRKVRIGGKEQEVSFNRFDSSVDPCQLLLTLHERLAKMGARFCWQTTVKAIGHRRAEVTNAGGESTSLDYKQAFVCTNAFSRGLHAATVVAPARGQILVTSPCRTETTHCLGYLRHGYDYFRFIGDRVLVGGGRLEFKSREDTDSFDVTGELRGYLVELARRVIGHRDFTVDYHWAGIMGLRLGKHASISDLEKPVHLDESTVELAGFGGWGVTLTPYVARLQASRYFTTG